MSEYKPIQTTRRLYEQVVTQIEQRVLQGELDDGYRFPPEADLAEQFGVSRPVIREAMKVLRQKGLVKVYPGRGTFVANSTRQAVSSSLDLMLRVENLGGLVHLAEAREMFEPPIAAMAASRHRPQHLDKLRQTLLAMHEAAAATPFDVDRFTKADLDFHLTLANATGNSLVEVLLNSFVGLQLDQRRKLIVRPGAVARAIHNHEEILQAVAARDPDRAHRAMKDHMAQVREWSERLEAT